MSSAFKSAAFIQARTYCSLLYQNKEKNLAEGKCCSIVIHRSGSQLRCTVGIDTISVMIFVASNAYIMI